MPLAKRLGSLNAFVRNLTCSVTRHAIWPLLAVVAASIATERALPLALGIAALLATTRWVATGFPSVRTPADVPILGLALMAAVSLAITVRRELTIPQVGRLVLGIAFYYELINWTSSRKRLDVISFGLALSGLVLALGAPFGVEWQLWKFSFIPPTFYAHFLHLGNDTINPNVMAGYLALLLPCVVAPIIFNWSGLALWHRTFYGLIMIMMLVMLLLTQSRGGLVAAIVGILVLVLLRWRWSWLIIAVGGGLGLIFSHQILALIGTNISTGGLDERIEVWTRGLYMIQDFAFTGIGMGSFAYVTERFYPLVLQATVPHAHNIFLQVAVDLGVPGLIAWLAVLGLAIAAAWSTYRRSRAVGDWSMTGFAAGLLGTQVVLVTHGMFDAITWGMVRPAVLIWGLWGVAIAAQNVVQASLDKDTGDWSLDTGEHVRTEREYDKTSV